MIKAIIVDDEMPAIGELKEYLSDLTEVEVLETFMNSYLALDYITQKTPDLVFLDINMPGMNGMELAWRIMDVSPATKVVFVTAFDKYAVEAFELNAIDYILKPIRKERMYKTIEKISNSIHHRKENIDKALSVPSVKLFGRVEVRVSDIQIRWNTAKVKEIFAYMLLNRYEKISRNRILEDIFNEEDNEKAKRYLNTCIYMIRKFIKEYGLEDNFILEFYDNNYVFKLNNVYIDFEDFKIKAKEAVESNNLKQIKEALKIYDEGFLVEIDSIWAIAEQEHAEMLYEELLESFIRALIDKGSYKEAEEFLQYELKKAPSSYILNLLMSKLLEKMGEGRKAKRYLKKCIEDL